MFSYYGSKSKIVHLYPAPKHGLIIEPFAGSARYALKYFDREVLLIDKYPAVIQIWHYLQRASEKDILGLPKLKAGLDISKLDISEIEKTLLGFIYFRGLSAPQKKVTDWVAYATGNENILNKLAKQLYKIRHWDIRQGNYSDAPDVEATWFIDPPYAKGGEHYKVSSKHLDFDELAKWSSSRKGQVLVCENSSAEWMPFIELAKNKSTSFHTKTTEVFWTNEKVEVQASLF